MDAKKWLGISLVLLSLVGCGGGSDSGGEKNATPPANVAPTADAGDDQTVDELTEVTLSGSGTDSDGSIASYLWEQTAGTSVSLTNANSASATFTAPDISTDETLTFKLTVTDDDGAIGTDTFTVYIRNIVSSGVGQFLTTNNLYAYDENHNEACISEFGSNARLADWTDIIDYYDANTELSAFTNTIAMGEQGSDSARSLSISYNNNEMYTSDRHYFIARHDHNKPGNFLSHANIDNHYIDMGSWTGDRAALCFISTVIIAEYIVDTSQASIFEEEYSLRNLDTAFTTTTQLTVESRTFDSTPYSTLSVIKGFDFNFSETPENPVILGFEIPAGLYATDVAIMHINELTGEQEFYYPIDIDESTNEALFELSSFSPVFLVTVESFKYGLNTSAERDLTLDTTFDIEQAGNEFFTKLGLTPKLTELPKSLFNLTRALTIVSSGTADYWLKTAANPFRWRVEVQKKIPYTGGLFGKTESVSNVAIWPFEDDTDEYSAWVWFWTGEDSGTRAATRNSADFVETFVEGMTYAELEALVLGQNLVFHSPGKSVISGNEYRAIAELATYQRAGSFSDFVTSHRKARLVFKTDFVEVEVSTSSSDNDYNSNGIDDTYEATKGIGNPQNNIIPTANAGSDSSHAENSSVQLTGSNSYDSDGTITSYLWSQVSGSQVTLNNNSQANATFTAPEVSQTTNLVFQLTVTDNDGDSHSDDVIVSILDTTSTNIFPTANAGSDSSHTENSSVQLTGASSYDSDGTITSYRWSQVSGTQVTLNNSTQANAAFTAPEVSQTTNLVFKLTVTDNDGAQSDDTVQITINDSLEEISIQLGSLSQNCSNGDLTATVSIFDSSGDALPNLPSNVFSLTESYAGSEHNIPPFTIYPLSSSGTGYQPGAYAIILDYSGSMDATNLSNMELAAIDFIQSMAEQDSVAIIKFDDSVVVAQTLTNDKQAAIAAIQASHSLGGSTAIYSATYDGVTAIAGAQQTLKQAVVFTDGENGTGRTQQEVIDIALASGVIIHAIGFSNADINELKQMTDATGGISLFANDMSDFSAYYQQLAQFNIDSYRLEWSTSAADSEQVNVQLSAMSQTLNLTGQSNVLNYTALQSHCLNQAPVISSSAISFNSEGDINITLQGEDSDGLIAGWQLVSLPSHGQIQLIDNVLYYTPDEGYVGEDTVMVEAADDRGAPSESFEVTFNVPQKETTQEANQGSRLNIIKDGATGSTYEIVNQPSHGLLVDNGYSWIYTANSGYVRDDFFVYRVINYDGTQYLIYVPISVRTSTTTVGKLNDTGLYWCTRASSSDQNCPIGQDSDFGRDALAAAGLLTKVGGGIAGFDFTKLDASGNALPETATEWSCVEDNHTGLIWEVKTNDGGLHHVSNTYTWYNPEQSNNGGDEGSINGGQCTGSDCDTLSYVNAVNVQSFCGGNNWRMPTLEELRSIGNYGHDAYSMAIDLNYFVYSIHGSFWSSSPDANVSLYAWSVNYNDTVSDDIHYKDTPLYIYLVRSKQ